MTPNDRDVVLSIRHAGLSFGARPLWSKLNLDVRVGELVAILGPNGAGKSSLMRAVLGAQPLDEGTIQLFGEPVRHGDPRLGYVPQGRLADRAASIRARDLVALGCIGHRYGLPLPSRRTRDKVDAALRAVGAADLAHARVGTLSGGELQRVRIGQALVGSPRLLLCDEPFTSLDINHQRVVSELIDQSRRDAQLGVLMITHDVNPILGMVDRVVYMAAGQARVGRVDEVLRSDVLSQLYDTRVDVLHSGGRILVVGAPEDGQGHLDRGEHHVEVPL